MLTVFCQLSVIKLIMILNRYNFNINQQKKGYNLMARHRDISKAHARLDGEEWHIEYHKEAIVTSNSRKTKKKKIPTKRDKRRCIHYNKDSGQCGNLKCFCMGSSGCISYSDKR